MIDLLEHLHARHEAGRPGAPAGGFVAFRTWDDADLRAIAAIGQREDVAAGVDLLAADAEDDRALFIVLSGRLEAYRSAGEGDRTIIEMLPGEGDPESDIGPMASRGMAWAWLGHDGTDYFDLHHNAEDTLDKVDPEALAQNVAAYAVFAYLAASAEGGFGSQPKAVTPPAE